MTMITAHVVRAPVWMLAVAQVIFALGTSLKYYLKVYSYEHPLLEFLVWNMMAIFTLLIVVGVAAVVALALKYLGKPGWTIKTVGAFVFSLVMFAPTLFGILSISY